MKIWVIGRNYPTPETGMAGTFEYEQAKMLARAGYEVTYLFLRFHPYKKFRKWGWVSFADGDVTVCASSHIYTPERMHMHYEPYQRWCWKRFIDRVQGLRGLPDVIHIHYPSMLTCTDVILPFQEKGVHIVCTEHWTSVLTKKLDAYQKRQLETYVVRSNAFICVGRPLKQAIHDMTGAGDDIEVVPNVVGAAFKPVSGSHSGFRFVATGRLEPVKQFAEIIEAFADVFAGRNDVTLQVVGGGTQFAHLQQIIHDKGVDQQVTLTGMKNRSEVAEIVANSDCLVCYSRLETFGVPVIEAWACGLPVIATTSLGFTEDWRPELGILIGPVDREKLTAALQRIYSDYSSYDHHFISEYAQKHYSESRVVERLSELYSR